MKNETRGIWSEIKPYRLSGEARKHSWHFASLYGIPSCRSDNLWYDAFIFRNDDRTGFGIREWIGQDPPRTQDQRPMATRVVLDAEFRRSLLSDHPDLPKIWKKH